MLQQHEYQQFADYFKFYVEDENPEDSRKISEMIRKLLNVVLPLGVEQLPLALKETSQFQFLLKFMILHQMMGFQNGTK